MSMKFVPIDKMSKKARKTHYAQMRSTNGFNTGTRLMQTIAHPTRAKQKSMDIKAGIR